MKTRNEILIEATDNVFDETEELGIKVSMDMWAKQFLEWVSDNCEIIREEKIILYRYHDINDGWGNYILDDIYTVFCEEMNK